MSGEAEEGKQERERGIMRGERRDRGQVCAAPVCCSGSQCRNALRMPDVVEVYNAWADEFRAIWNSVTM